MWHNNHRRICVTKICGLFYTHGFVGPDTSIARIGGVTIGHRGFAIGFCGGVLGVTSGDGGVSSASGSRGGVGGREGFPRHSSYRTFDSGMGSRR